MTGPKPPVSKQLAVIGALGTVRQAVLDLGIVSTRLADLNAGLVSAGERGHGQLAATLDSLSSELGQAAAWLRDAQ